MASMGSFPSYVRDSGGKLSVGSYRAQPRLDIILHRTSVRCVINAENGRLCLDNKREISTRQTRAARL